MQSEQQQRIMGYFIEEAKDHLNTIEQGLLNLQSTIEDSEMVNEVFRAAHSVKGGAAMLGLSSIQRTSHRLEDYFKVLRECPVRIDQKLESLFLRVFDTLQELLDQLQGPFGLTEDKADEIMANVEPVFTELHGHLAVLVEQAGGTPPEDVDWAATAGGVAKPGSAPANDAAMRQAFQANVPAQLREMLQLFKQSEGDASRQQLQVQCQTLARLGEQFNVASWCELLRKAERAIACPENSFKNLAPVLIRDIKGAQDLILAGKAAEIACSDALEQLIPASEEPTLTPEAALDELFAAADAAIAVDESLFLDGEPSLETGNFDLTSEDLTAEDVSFGVGDRSSEDWFKTDLAAEDRQDSSVFDDRGAEASSNLDNLLSMGSDAGDAWGSDRADVLDLFEEQGLETGSPDVGISADPIGPEVGAAELNSLADLFGDASADLGLPWDEEMVVEDPEELLDALDLETSDDFSDLLFDQDVQPSRSTRDDDISGFFNLDASTGSGDALQDEAIASLEAMPSPEQGLDELFDALSDTDGLGMIEDVSSSSESASFEALFEDGAMLDGAEVEPLHDAITAEFAAVGEGTENDLGLLDDTWILGNVEGLGNAEGAEETDADAGSDLLIETETDTPLDEVTSEPIAAEALFESGETPADGDVTADLWGTEEAAVDQPDDAQGEISSDQWAMFQDTEDAASEAVSDEDLLAGGTAKAAETPIPEDTITALTDLMEESPEAVSLTADDGGIEPAMDLDHLFDEQDGATRDAIVPEAVAESFLDSDLDFSDLPDFDEATASEVSDTTDLSLDLDAELGEWRDMPSLADANLESLDGSNLDHEPLSDLFGDSAVSTEEQPLTLDSNDGDLFEDSAADLSFDEEGSSRLPEEQPSEMETMETSDPWDEASGLTDIDTVGEGEAEAIAPALELDEFTIADVGEDENFAFGKDDDCEISPLMDQFDCEISPVMDQFDTDQFDDAFAAQPDAGEADTDFSDLEALLGEESMEAIAPATESQGMASEGDDFADLEALIGSEAPAEVTDEFDDLEKLLEDAEQTLGGTPTSKARRGAAPALRRPTRSRPTRAQADQNMRVSVKNLDNLNNLIGELVVNRNSLEQTQERLRQFLDNLLYQVQQLSDVGQRMRDLYERSLLESSLLSSRRNYSMHSFGSTGGNSAPQTEASHATGASFDALEMDRFTGFHTLSQEMIELIVRVRESASDIDFVVEESDQVTRTFRQVTTQLQEGLNRARMVPFAQTADRLPRAVRDISLRCGKQAELVVEGRDTLIDKMILEQLYDPMTHLVNNAITHGIETPEERQAAGKPAAGKIVVRSFHQGNQTVISITDDGAGIDPERVKRKALEKGVITPQEAQEMSRHDVYDLLFHSGFSTRDQADDFAGRGVGMDVVRTNLNEIRGTITTDSTVGSGTTFTIRLPLTLSISKALSCISNRARIAFPMDGVEDMLDVPKERIQTDEEGRPCILWRDILLPFQPLNDLLTHNRVMGRGSVYGGQEEDIVSIVVLRSATNYLALQVDQVLGEQEIVIKQLEGPVPKPVGIAGATVLGDGRIMPIADILELIDLSLGRIRRDGGSSLWAKEHIAEQEASEHHEPTVLIVDDSITVRELLSMTFNKAGYRVEQARDGQEAWEKLRSGLPCDLVFCDIEMPRMDGLELLSQLQKDPTLSSLPIAMLTSRGADRHRQMAVSLGAKGYFTKPYLEEVLLDAAQRMLKGEVLVGSA
ncbi:MAG: response regulator [Synechococcales cyanobacterium T60_A2020_003]|nr:response regulator [Synechococcales cyanobacterium T60_A2020_003]